MIMAQAANRFTLLRTATRAGCATFGFRMSQRPSLWGESSPSLQNCPGQLDAATSDIQRSWYVSHCADWQYITRRLAILNGNAASVNDLNAPCDCK